MELRITLQFVQKTSLSVAFKGAHYGCFCLPAAAAIHYTLGNALVHAHLSIAQPWHSYYAHSFLTF